MLYQFNTMLYYFELLWGRSCRGFFKSKGRFKEKINNSGEFCFFTRWIKFTTSIICIQSLIKLKFGSQLYLWNQVFTFTNTELTISPQLIWECVPSVNGVIFLYSEYNYVLKFNPQRMMIHKTAIWGFNPSDTLRIYHYSNFNQIKMFAANRWFIDYVFIC